jgi:FAD dependent oxidoreductase TIGR03364
MYSGSELRVDPRTACDRIARWLQDSFDVECCFDTTIVRVEDHFIHSADGGRWKANRTILCSGSDLKTIHRRTFQASGLVLCKLQMLKTVRQPGQPDMLAPHIASGLTLRHYPSFNTCPSHAKLKARIKQQSPELDQFGIHVMASLRPDGEVILGDSHEYGDDITPFDNQQIDDLILRELRHVIQLEDWTINQRWHGIYAKHPTLPVFQAELAGGVHAFVGTGGAGMTMSFGLAERFWTKQLGAS